MTRFASIGCFGIAAVIAAWFEFRDRGQGSNEQAKTKESYAAKWRLLDSTGLLKLPEAAIGWILTLKSSAT